MRLASAYKNFNRSLSWCGGRGAGQGLDEESFYRLRRNTKKERERCMQIVSLNLTDRCIG